MSLPRYSLLSILFAAVLAVVLIAAHVAAAAGDLDVSKIAGFSLDRSLLAPNDLQFAKLTRPGRNYNLVLLFTATKDSGAECGTPCRIGEKLMTAAKYSYDAAVSSGQSVPLVHFAVLDFKESHKIMQQLKLTHLPQIFIWPATIGTQKGKVPTGGKSYHEFTGVHKGPEVLLKELNRITGGNIAYSEPVDYSRLVKLALTAGGVLGGGYVFWPILYRLLSSRALWALVSTTFMLIMHGGYMWVNIRRAPFSNRHHDGSEELVSSGLQSQLGAEIYSTAATVAAGILASLLLVVVVPRMNGRCADNQTGGSASSGKGSRGNSNRARSSGTSMWAPEQCEKLQLVVAGTCILIIIFSFSALVRIFSQKISYPYRMFL